MFFPEPNTYPDAVSINSYQGKPLIFYNEEKCMEWVYNDLDNIKAYAKKVYPKAIAVKEIMCVYKKPVTEL